MQWEYKFLKGKKEAKYVLKVEIDRFVYVINATNDIAFFYDKEKSKYLTIILQESSFYKILIFQNCDLGPCSYEGLEMRFLSVVNEQLLLLLVTL